MGSTEGSAESDEHESLCSFRQLSVLANRHCHGLFKDQGPYDVRGDHVPPCIALDR